ncbi:uncharacterized protein LOC121743062 [Salvia splendens]|uniref:uncharacterized protein LOC121743062 n=1 Tax=Salvia splendens TaxID=180675 RepID=UPI001C25AB73|nr:uncharacterized protein LOC121743062 [Salvia splendens]
MSPPEAMYDVAMKPKLLRSLLREYVPDEKHPFTNPSELSYVVSAVKTHKLLSERAPPEAQQDLVDAWKSAVDSWVNRLLALASSNLPDKCWAGICLLGLTCQECSSERFLTSYDVWLNKLLVHIQPSEVSHFVKASSCASLSDMFTRLDDFSNVKKDATSLATKVTQQSLKLLNEESSSVVLEEAMCLLRTLIDFFPSAVHRHYDSVEAAIVSKLISGKCSPSVLKNLGHGLSLLPKSRGDEDSWSLMMNKILLYVNSQLNDAFQGLEEETRNAKAMRALLPAGKEPPPPLGGSEVSDHSSDISARSPERLLASRISSLLLCCSDMLTTPYPVMVHVPICGLIALAGRVLLVDGFLPLSSYSFMTTLKQEFVCSEIPNMQYQSLEILTAIVKGLGSQVLPYVAEIFELLKEYLSRCKIPGLKIKAYSILKVLLISMGVGLAIHVSQNIVSNVFVDLDFLGIEKDVKSSGTNTKVQSELSNDVHYKKRKRGKVSLQEQPAHGGLEEEMSINSTPISVKIAALEALEALLTVGGSVRSESWRGDVDKLLITVATYACRGGSKEERKILLSGDATPTWADFQVAALRALLASLLSPGRVRPSHLALSLQLFRKGMQAADTKLAEHCGHALLALEVLIHPRSLPLLNFNSDDDGYKALGHLRDPVYPSGDRRIPNYQHDEPESEEDDLIENWRGKDDEMEIQVTERQQPMDPADEVSSGVDVLKKNEVTTSENGPDNNGIEAKRFKSASDQSGGVLESVELEPANGKAAPVENNITAESGAVSVSENIYERISATLSRIDRSNETMFEVDDEAEDVFPDIVDGDPDSD